MKTPSSVFCHSVSRNEGLVIDSETGIPSLKAHRAEGQRASAKALEQEIKARMPERSLAPLRPRVRQRAEG
ncbi:hypothetical protein [Streptomyces sp. NPDC019937]|uniref:hypothetical protein n=1 Tax=Streptomyces sp. NPDC019937 TaxID=3154787 RepID=UPI0033E778D5